MTAFSRQELIPSFASLFTLSSCPPADTHAQTKSLPNSLTFSPTGSHFATTSLLSDRQIRIFTFLSGKLYRKYDESLSAIQELQQAGSSASAAAEATATAVAVTMKLDEMEFGRRLAAERELAERSPEAARRENAEWDETGNFLLYPSLVGIKGTWRCEVGVIPLTP